jgi:hypothetical protein
MLGIVVILLAVVAVIGAHYGPKYWLYVAVVSALALGIALGWLRSENSDGLLAGACVGIVFALVLFVSGISVRRAKRQGAKRLDESLEKSRQRRKKNDP